MASPGTSGLVQPALSDDLAAPLAAVSDTIIRDLANSARAAIFILDNAGLIVDVNRPAEELLGRSAQELRGTQADSVIRVASERIDRIGVDRAENGFDLSHEGKWFEVFGYKLEWAENGPLLVVRLTDVTSRKSNEFEMMESEARLEEATRIGRMGTFKIVWKPTDVTWSHQMFEIHGLTPDSHDPSVDPYLDVVFPDDRPRFQAYSDNLFKGREVSGSEYRIVKPNGEIRWLRLDGRVLFDVDGRPYASFGTAQDITEAKEREEALRDLLERNTLLFEALQASPVGVAVYTLTGHSPTIYHANPAFQALTGYSLNDLTGRALDILIGPESDDHARAVLRGHNDVEEREPFDFVCYRKDGLTFIAEMDIAAVRGADGSIVARIVNLRDVTEARHRTEAMMESQKMEALGKLSGGVAHEINNLLQPIITLSDLGTETVGNSNAKLAKYFEVIAGSGRKAREVVRQILTFSRQDAPKISAQVLAPIIADSVRLAESGLRPDAKIDVSIDDTNALALVNPTQVSQIVINLLRNAADASEESQTITLTFGRLTPDEVLEADLPAGDHSWLRLSISDQGGGMDDETKSRVFEPFFTTKPVGRGTGLGLSVVYSIVQGWGGRIRLESEVDKGTSAMVYIPEFVAEQQS